MTERRIGYVLKRYPRLSETFILNEILAHEAAGTRLHIFSLRTPEEDCVHEDVHRVRADVTYLSRDPVDAVRLGEVLCRLGDSLEDRDRKLAYQRPKAVWTLLHAAMVAQEAADRGISHLHAHFATEATTIARLAALIGNMTYSFTAHAKDIFHESVDPDDLRCKMRDAASIVTVSDFNVSYLREQFVGEGGSLRRIYNGLDLNEFPFRSTDRDPELIIGVGRLVEKKGFADLISACALLESRGRSFRCLIVGHGELHDELASQIAALDLQHRVEMVGARPRDEVRELVAKASMLAAPCVVGTDGNRDGLPTVLLEAMALGTPCISTPVTGIPEVIRHEQTGLMVREHDPLSLVHAIERMMDRPEEARGFAEASRALIEQSFDLHRNVRELSEIFETSPVSGVS